MAHVVLAGSNPDPATETIVPGQPLVGVMVIAGVANALSTADRVRRTNRADKAPVRDARVKIIARSSMTVVDY